MKILKTVLFAIVVIISQNGINAQSIKAAQLPQKLLDKYNEAIKLSRQGKTKDAIKKIDEILKKAPNFHDANLRKAAINYDIGNLKEAKILFDDVIKKDAKYDMEMYYNASVVAMAMKDYKSASNHLSYYLQNAALSEERKAKTIYTQATAAFRDNAINNPKPYEIQSIKGDINTAMSEFLPSTTIDGKQMIFTRRMRGADELFMAQKDSMGNWKGSQPLFEEIDYLNKASATLSQDGKTIIFVICDDKQRGMGSCDLYISNLINNKWSKPTNMGKTINTIGWESQPCLSENGNTLLFSSNRKGGSGGNDLWVSYKNKNNQWSNPQNLSKTINSDGNDESPFLHPDGKTLFFRSTGHIGMGSFDLFYSRFDENAKKWSKPENLGYPINTEGQEGSLFVDRDGITCYYASDVDNKKVKKDNLDLYTFKLPKEFQAEATGYVKLTVVNKQEQVMIGSNYIVINLETRDTLLQGKYDGINLTMSLPANKNYALLISNRDYYPHSSNFNTKEEFDRNKPLELKIVLDEVIKKNQPIVLNNIFFESGSSILKQESQVEISNLVNFLTTYENLKIEIVGHTDDVGNDMDNMKLSEARAKSVYTALLEQGINANRLSYVGKGETVPIADNKTEEGRRKNRRTEFTSK